jgi:hypothetical protein
VGDDLTLLGPDLRARASPDLQVPSGAAVVQVRWLGADDWLVESSGIATGETAVALVDAEHATRQVVRDHLAMVELLLYEPSTGLATLSLGDTAEVLRYDAAHHRVDRVAAVKRARGFEQLQLWPLAPALAGGAQLLLVRMAEHVTLHWSRDAARPDSGKALVLDGSVGTADAAGRAYVWTSVPGGLALAQFFDGARVAGVPTDGPAALFPDPTGARIAAVGQHGVVLLARDGAAWRAAWSQPLVGVTEALWLDDGALAIVSAGGLARLDPASGAVIAARCGWHFGLSSKPHPVTPRIEPVCAQLAP